MILKGSGDFGCAYVSGDITGSTRVYCDGKYGCYHVDDGTISAPYVEVTGYYGAYYSNIEATYDIYCSGRYSCYHATIDAGDDVIVQSYIAVYGATITAADCVYCDAEYGCYYATITAGRNVYIDASRAAYYADITAERVYGYGHYGLWNADITSIEYESLYVYLYSRYAAYYADIFCLDGSNCYIYCYDDLACRYLDIYYYGEEDDIYVYPTDCKDDGNAGSTNGDGVYCPSLTDSSSMSEEEYKAMRQKLVEASDDYQELYQAPEEKRLEGEKARIKDEKDMKAKMKMTEIQDKSKRGEQRGESSIFTNVDGLLEHESYGINNILSIYSMLFGAILTFIIMSCYYSRCRGEDDAKYQPLLS